jgi:hypothetical protein
MGDRIKPESVIGMGQNMHYQATKIHYKAEPDTLEEFYELVSETAGKEHVQRIKGENAVAITVLGLDALEQVEFTLWRICKEQTTNYTVRLEKGRETAYLSLTKPLEKSDRPIKTLPVDLGPTWQKHDEWLEQKLPGQYFGHFDNSVQGVCLTEHDLEIEFGYSSLLLKENEEAKSSHDLVVLVTPGEHYEEAIAKSWGDPTLRLFRAIRMGDIESTREAINDGAVLDRLLGNVSNMRPLSEAVVSNDLEIVQLLLEAGADTNSLAPNDHRYLIANLISGNISAEMFMLIGNHRRSKELFERWLDALAEEFGKTDADRRREDQQFIDIKWTPYSRQ